ncbi:ribosomal protein S18-alanine N-acetyltransferase [Actinomyces faecalis]|uniref:ribosomal protein S18-alanine N-acetyltransferase n=1 Tax=Actinomyces faecalis TaxID=2722820 RepID=UPI001556C8F3|nr:ribosomal protein S18-alanine N-acetyltransferase [Actinomyces faecalis]
MEVGDLAEVSHLERELFGGEAWSASLLADELQAATGPEADRGYVVVVDGDGVVVGYAGLWFGDGRGEADLLTIATVPAARRRGVATSMLRAVVRQAREAGCAGVLLEVRASNEAAQTLYARHGFRPLGRRRRYYSAPVEDAVVMRLDLRPGPGPVGSEIFGASSLTK